MRSLADGVEKRSRRVILGVSHDGYADAQTRGNRSLRHRLSRVVRALGVNVGAQLFEERFDGCFGKNHDIVNAAKSSDEQRASVFIEDGTARPFQSGDAGVGVDGHNEKIAFAARSLQIPNVANVQSVKAAVGEDDALSAPFVLGELALENIPRDDLGRDSAHNSGSRSGSFPTNGFEQFLARDGGGAAFHDDESAGDVGDMRGFERRCFTSERQSICGKNCIPRAGDIDGLIAAMDGDVSEPIIGFKKGSAVASSSNEERL
jgi:hypothetical protein